ncbi:MAG: S8 family serine peptidase, partial [Chloroflexota bacterium]
MRREAIGLFLAALIVVPAGAVQAAAPLGTPSRGSDRADPAGRWIVLTRNGADPKAVRDRHAHRDGIKADRLFAHAAHGFSSKLSGEQVAALRADPDVAAVVPDEVVTVAGQLTPTGVARIGTKLSSVAKIDGIDQRVDADVAVVDTGIDRTHPDLNVVGGVNCSSSDRTAWQDENHHGTHVAGTIGALDNGIGVVGV